MITLAVLGTIATYASLAVSVASLALTAYMAFTAPGPEDGPRIGETDIQTSTYGGVIPAAWGRVRMAGNIIWADDIQEVASQESVGKGGGGSRTVYSYFGNLAVGLCEGPAVGVTRVWADKKIIFDRTGRSAIVRKYPTMDMRVHLGTPTQIVDPLIEASTGVGATSAHRGICYVVFEGLPLEDFGNRIPQLQFEIQFSTENSTTEIQLPTMFDWAVDSIYESRISGFLYFTRRHDVEFPNAVTFSLVIWDIFNEVIFKQIGNSPYKNEGIFGPLGFWCTGGIFPGDDGKVFAVGRKGDGGNKALVQINPITLDHINSWNLTDLLGSTGNLMRRANFVWSVRTQLGVDTYQLILFNGAPSSDLDVWLLFHRGLGEGGRFTPLNFLGDPVLSDPFFTHGFDFGPPNRGPVWPNTSAVDSDGNLWIAGRMDNTIDGAKGILGNRSAKLWKVQVVTTRTTGGDIKKLIPRVTEIDLAELDPTGRIHIPELMVYDAASNSLTIWGSLDPDSDFGIVQYSIESGTIINSVYYKIPPDNHFQPSNFNTGAGAGVVHSSKYSYFQNGTNSNGEIIFPKNGINGADQWTIYNAKNFTFTKDQPGPFLTGKVSQWYWYKELDWIYSWIGPGADNPSDDNPTVFERFTLNAAADKLDVVVKQIIADTDVPNSDVVTDATMADTIVEGFILGSQGRSRGAINPLGFAYFFDAVESDSKIEFRSRGVASIRTIPANDLGAKAGSGGQGDNDAFITTRQQETDVPMRVDLAYLDIERDHLRSNQHSTRSGNPTPTQFSNSVFSSALPLVMGAAQAKAITEIKLYDSWAARTAHKYQLGPKHMDLEPTDIVTVEVDKQPDTLMRVGQTQLGEAFVSRFEGITHDPEVFTTVGTGAKAALVGGVLVFQGATEAFMLDIPLLIDEHNIGGLKSGFYVAMGGQRATWTAGLILKSQAGGGGPFDLFDSSAGGHAWGFLNVALPALPDTLRPPSGSGTTMRSAHHDLLHRIDYENEIQVRIVNDEALLSSVTESTMLETNANVAVIIDPQTKDRFEIFQFVNVSVSSGIATLTGLMRGLRGTEEQARFGFAAGLKVVFLDRSVTHRKLIPLSDINTQRVYEVKTSRQTLDSAQLRWVVAQGNDLRPLSGSEVRATPLAGSRSGSTITIFWDRRSRVFGERGLEDEITEIPLGETTPVWEVDLIDDGLETVSITKTLDTGASSAPLAVGVDFTVTERTDAGYTNNEAVRVKIYQMSDEALIGRGFPRDVLI